MGLLALEDEMREQDCRLRESTRQIKVYSLMLEEGLNEVEARKELQVRGEGELKDWWYRYREYRKKEVLSYSGRSTIFLVLFFVALFSFWLGIRFWPEEMVSNIGAMTSVIASMILCLYFGGMAMLRQLDSPQCPR